MRLRLIEFPDWHTPSTLSDDGTDFGGEDSDSGDSNFNATIPASAAAAAGHGRERLVSPVRMSCGWVARGFGPAFWAQETSSAIVVGDVSCPTGAPRGAMPCRLRVSALCAEPATRVDHTMAEQVDYTFPSSPCSLRSTK